MEDDFKLGVVSLTLRVQAAAVGPDGVAVVIDEDAAAPNLTALSEELQQALLDRLQAKAKTALEGKRKAIQTRTKP